MKTLTDLFPKLDIHNVLLEKLSDTEIKNAYAKKSTREIGFTLCGQFDDGELNVIKNAIIKECNASDVIIELEAKEIGAATEISSQVIEELASEISPVARGFLSDCTVTCINDEVLIELAHGGLAFLEGMNVAKQLQNSLLKKFAKLYKCTFKGITEIDAESDEYKTSHVDEGPVIKKQATEENQVIYGKPIKKSLIPINTLSEETGSAAVRGRVFAFDRRITKDGSKMIASFGISDGTSSLKVKFVPLPTVDEGNRLMDKIEKAGYVTIQGEISYDKYDRDIFLNPRNIVSDKEEERMDNAPVKRVELHLHTTMSMKDAVTTPDKYIKRAKKWGLDAIAITDHGVIQAFPSAYLSAQKIGYEGKIIYGVEDYFVNDTHPVMFGSCDDSFEDTIVCFDLETTGFSAVNDRIIEIGAVKIQDGIITDKFNMFVYPEKPIPAKVIELTGINDSMVADAPSQEEAVRKFIDFAGNSMLVAHNASFDMSFINAACERYEIPYRPAYLDTLALSRKMYRGLKNYKLNTLAEHFEVGDFNHHRASDDAAILAKILLCMLTDLKKEQGLTSFENFNNEINANYEGTDLSKMKPNHQTILVKNRAGLRNLFIMISESHLKYYNRRPIIPKSLLMQYRDGLIIGSACEAGELYTAFIENRSQKDIEDIASFYDYLEIQPLCNNMFLVEKGMVSDVNQLKNINKKICELGDKLGKPVVATCDVHFLDPEDEQFRKVLLIAQEFSDGGKPMPLYLRTTEEMLAEFSYLGDELARKVVIDNTRLIADMCENFSPLPPNKLFKPTIEGAEEELYDKSFEKAKNIYGDELPEWISERLKTELTAIIENGYAVTYIIAKRLVEESNRNGYLVGSRGSVGSSIAAFMSGITEVNGLPPHYICSKCKYLEQNTIEGIDCGVDMPDKVCPVCGEKLTKAGFDIPFQTFLGFEADKVPDIDLNFASAYQSQMHKYVEKLLGSRNIFRAGTINALQEKNAIGYVKKYAERIGVQLSNLETLRLAQGLVGVKMTTGQHPGGVMVVPQDMDIYDFCPIQHPADDSDKGTVTTHFEYKYIHDNLLKLDMLGHDDPTVLKMLQDITGIDGRDIPLDDKDVMEIFLSNKSLNLTRENPYSNVGTIAISEFGTRFVRGMLEKTKPTTFSELVKISGLSHGTDVWLGNAETLIDEGTATLKEVICTRDDIMLYLIGKGMDKKLSFTIMEAVRKGKHLKPEWEVEMRAHEVPEWYIESCNKIAYMFPKAHAVAYVMMAFRIAWFKVHKPLAFYAAYFSIRADLFNAETMIYGIERVEDKIRELEALPKMNAREKSELTIYEVVYEYYLRGYSFSNVDIEKSHSTEFIVCEEENKLIPPFNTIAHLGDTAAESVVAEREKGKFESIEELLARTSLNSTNVEDMKKLGILNDLPDSSQITFF